MKYADQKTVNLVLQALQFADLQQFKQFIVEVAMLEKLDDNLLEFRAAFFEEYGFNKENAKSF